MTDMNIVTDVLGKLEACRTELQSLASNTHDKKEKQKFKKIEQSIQQCKDMLDGTIDSEITKHSLTQNSTHSSKKGQNSESKNSTQGSRDIKIPDLD